MDNSLNDNRTIKLLISNTLFRSATLVSQIFLNIFLFKNTNDIGLVALFNIYFLVMHAVSFTFFARVVKFGYRNITHIISLLGLSFVYLFLVILGDSILNYYVFLALGIGFFNGIYWITYNNNEFDMTTVSNRGNFQGLKKSLKTLSSIIVPSLVGTIIGLNYLGYGYEIAFSLGIILFMFSAFIGIIKIEYNSNIKYSLKNALKKLKKEKDLVKAVSNLSLLSFSLSNNLVSTILPLLLFSYGMQEINLGFLVSFFAILTIIFSYLFGKFVDYKKYKMVYVFSGCVYIISVCILIFFPTYWYIIFFASVLNLLFSFMDISQSVFSANIFHSVKGYENIKSEYMVIREWLITLGKVLSFSCIYFIGNFEILGVKILFGIMAFVILISVYLFTSINYQ